MLEVGKREEAKGELVAADALDDDVSSSLDVKSPRLAFPSGDGFGEVVEGA